MVKHRDLIAFLEELAPPDLSESWDNSGLQVGDPQGELRGVLLCLDLSPAVFREASRLGANFILTHHPLLFSSLKSVRVDRFPGCLLREALVEGTTVYAAHTNLDAAFGGVSDALADLFGLEQRRVLAAGSRQSVYKLVTFLPPAALRPVAAALFAAGAGVIGNYSHCAFASPGTGSLRPEVGSRPWSGQPEQLNYVTEQRLEVRVPENKLAAVVAALRRSHPYEEPAYDLYPLADSGAAAGCGRIGELPEPRELPRLVAEIKEKLGLAAVRLIGAGEGGGQAEREKIRRLAVCGGSGFSLYSPAVAAGADLFLTGDLKYHDARHVEATGVPVVDAGHFATERPVLPVVGDKIRAFLARQGVQTIGVEVFAAEKDPFVTW